MADNSLTRLSLAGQLGVSLFLAALICGLFWYFWYSDALDRETQKKARLETLNKEIRALEVTAAKLQEFQREVQLLEAKLETLKRILPPEKEMPDLMRRVQYLCSQSSLQIRKFTPGTVATKEFYQEVPINIDVEGTYHNLGAFFDRISRLSRLVNMGTIKINAQQNQTGSNTVAASTVATTYVYVDTPPPPPGPPGAPRPPGAAR
jgi:type IV pilus assembly protein PilO